MKRALVIAAALFVSSCSGETTEVLLEGDYILTLGLPGEANAQLPGTLDVGVIENGASVDCAAFIADPSAFAAGADALSVPWPATAAPRLPFVEEGRFPAFQVRLSSADNSQVLAGCSVFDAPVTGGGGQLRIDLVWTNPPLCEPDCSGRVCGDDGCDGMCGSCTTAELCNASGQCIPDPDCGGLCQNNRTCGELECIGDLCVPETGQCGECVSPATDCIYGNFCDRNVCTPATHDCATDAIARPDGFFWDAFEQLGPIAWVEGVRAIDNPDAPDLLLDIDVGYYDAQGDFPHIDPDAVGNDVFQILPPASGDVDQPQRPNVLRFVFDGSTGAEGRLNLQHTIPRGSTGLRLGLYIKDESRNYGNTACFTVPESESAE